MKVSLLMICYNEEDLVIRVAANVVVVVLNYVANKLIILKMRKRPAMKSQV